jgi:hypothetical protein
VFLPADHLPTHHPSIELIQMYEFITLTISKDNPFHIQVFQVPEFYMRGVNGAYNASQLVDGTLPIGDAMWDIIKGPKWAHWMFVMGESVSR